MIEKKYKRTALRSPMKSNFLFCLGNTVGKSKTLNISQGGLLMEEIPGIKVGDVFPIMVEMPKIPILSLIPEKKIYHLDPIKFERGIIRTEVEVVRNFKGQTSFKGGEIGQMGGKFFQMPKMLEGEINDYVISFRKNVVYILNIIVDLGQGKRQMPLLKHISFLLGYEVQDNISLLRQKVLHDYQSLEDF
jgi:hypothetical protein